MAVQNNTMNKTVFIGQRFGRWTVISEQYYSGKSHIYATCQCECGTERAIRLEKLYNGSSNSCGCYAIDLLTTHGMTATSVRKNSHEYWIWNSMVGRCKNSNYSSYENYGARGITVCNEWLKFENFYRDMGPRPSRKHSIDRIDNNKGYCPENCKWTERTEQNRNKRNNRFITVDGVTKCLQEWAEDIGISHGALIQRLKKWPPELAVTIPKNGKYGDTIKA